MSACLPVSLLVVTTSNHAGAKLWAVGPSSAEPRLAVGLAVGRTGAVRRSLPQLLPGTDASRASLVACLACEGAGHRAWGRMAAARTSEGGGRRRRQAAIGRRRATGGNGPVGTAGDLLPLQCSSDVLWRSCIACLLFNTNRRLRTFSRAAQIAPLAARLAMHANPGGDLNLGELTGGTAGCRRVRSSLAEGGRLGREGLGPFTYV